MIYNPLWNQQSMYSHIVSVGIHYPHIIGEASEVQQSEMICLFWRS